MQRPSNRSGISISAHTLRRQQFSTMLSTTGSCIRSGASGGVTRRKIFSSTPNFTSTVLLRSRSELTIVASWSTPRSSYLSQKGLLHTSTFINASGVSLHQQQREFASASTISTTSYTTSGSGGIFARPFSSAASTSSAYPFASPPKDTNGDIGNNNSNSNSNSNNNNSNNNNKDKKDNSSLFFDNLGKIFLLVIASIIASLVRSSAGTRNRNVLRDALEDIALVDPMELEELRLANSALDPETFRVILKQVHKSFPQGTCSYHDFVLCVRKTMAQLKGDAFTVELGHLLDRLMVQVLNKHTVADDSSSVNVPVNLFLTALTMALYSDTKERIRILYDILQLQEEQSEQQPSTLFVDDNEANYIRATVNIDQVRSMVGHLQETCQLPPDTQIVPTETKYPTQQWKRGSPRDLVPWSGGSEGDLIDLYTFASILRSKSVCVWGECYYKRKFEEEDV
jgi:hypothetical protein